MKYFNWFILFVFFISISVFSQDKFTRHTVSKGETISKIAKQYNVSPKAIYELNPDASKGIKFKSVLIIPIASSNSRAKKTATENADQISDLIHEVLSQETLYGIAKLYGVKVEDLYSSNPNLEQEGLKKGQTISIPQTESNKSIKVATVEKDISATKISTKDKSNPTKEDLILPKQIEKREVSTELANYEVLPKETIYSITKQNGITVSDLYKLNQNLEREGLKSGQTIKIPQKGSNKAGTTSASVAIEMSIPKKKEEVVLTQTAVSNATTTYKVLPNESLFSIAKKLGITIADLKKANPKKANQSLRSGQIITIPVKIESKTIVVSKGNAQKTDSDIAVSSSSLVESSAAEKEYTREVLSKETKYGIAKEYGITVNELEKQNPKIVKKLTVGSTLSIRSSKVFEHDILNEDIVVEDVNKNNTSPFRDPVFLDQLIQTASENIGTRYRMGGTTILL